jgi:protein associated with RNAse G/E
LKIDLVVWNKSNSAVWKPNMETLLKSKGMCYYMKIVSPDPLEDEAKFIVDGKMDETVGVIMTYISWEIHFHLSGMDFPHQVQNKLKSLFEKVNEIHFMQLEKELIYIYHHYFDIIEDYLVRVK